MSCLYSPFHVNSQENVSEKEEGDGEGHGLQSVPHLSALGWQGEVHNHQHNVHNDQHHTKYTAEEDTIKVIIIIKERKRYKQPSL